MPPTLIVQYKNDTFSVQFNYKNVSDLQKWIIDIDLVSIILNQRPSYAVVYDSSNKFKFDPFEIEKSVGKSMKSDESYLYAGPGKWSQKDIENIVLEDGFELSEIWFYIPSKEKTTEINPIELFENVFHPLNGDEKYVDESKIECLGRCEDGALLLWQNPNPDDLKHLKNVLPELCQKYNYDLKFVANTEKLVPQLDEPNNGANFNHIHHDFEFLANVEDINEEFVPHSYEPHNCANFNHIHDNFTYTEVFPPQDDKSYNFSHIHKTLKRGAKVGESTLYNAKRFDIRIPKAGSNVVNFIDKTIKNAKGKPNWLLRFDGPHRGAEFNHININPEIFGVPDPHTRISAGQLSAAKTSGKVLKTVNKVAVPVAIAIDTGRMGYSVYKDVENGTIRNTIETGASVAGGWGGGYGGAAGGAAVGTSICPGIGTVAGGIIGGVFGGLTGSMGAAKLAEAVNDKLEVDVERRECSSCQQVFTVRIYKGEKDQWLCQKCR